MKWPQKTLKCHKLHSKLPECSQNIPKCASQYRKYGEKKSNTSPQNCPKMLLWGTARRTSGKETNGQAPNVYMIAIGYYMIHTGVYMFYTGFYMILAPGDLKLFRLFIGIQPLRPYMPTLCPNSYRMNRDESQLKNSWLSSLLICI